MFQKPELSIHKELEDLLYTDKDCTPIKLPYVHRKFRRDATGQRERCPGCNRGESGSKEGLLDCPYCKGEGYLWDDVLIEGYMFTFIGYNKSIRYHTEAGYNIEGSKKLITPSKYYVREKDYVFDLVLDRNNKIQIPIQYDKKFICIYADKYSSNGADSQFNIHGLKS